VEDEESPDEGEEDFSMLIRMVGKMFYKKGGKITFREKDLKKKNERRRKWVLATIARRCDTSLRIAPNSSNYLQEIAHKEGHGGHIG